MPSLFKRSNGIYYVSFERAGKRKWRSTGRTRKSEALSVIPKLKSTFDEHGPRLSYQNFTKELTDHCGVRFSPKTQVMYRSAMNRFGQLIGNKLLASITTKDADNFRTARAREVSPVSVNVDLRTLKSAFYIAMRWDLIDKNPFKGMPMMRVPDQMPVYFTKAEFAKFLSVIGDEWLRDLVIVGVSTGLRRGELLALTWSDVDFERKLIHIHSSENFRTKAGKRRSVPMNEVVCGTLSRRKGRSIDKSVFNPEHKSDINHIATKRFKIYVRKAGLNPKLHFHSLRHTFATWLVQGGVGIYEVQKLLGHSSIAVTQIYSHLASSELHSAVRRISIPIIETSMPMSARDE